MSLEFDIEKIVEVEFCLSLDSENGEEHVRVPADLSVKNILISMLGATIDELTPQDGTALGTFELSEKYGPKEALTAPLDEEGFEKVRTLYGEQNWPNSSAALQQSKDLAYYFAVFQDDVGRKLIGVRRASQFKAILSAQNRLIRWVDDSLKVMAENVFRLDNDFDFVISRETVYILRPSGFEFISDVSTAASEKAREKALALSEILPFVGFERIADYAASHRRAARLIAAISIRDDLNKIQKDRLRVAAQGTKVELEETDGKLQPKQGNELGFLELLDHRRYTTSLTDDPPTAFVASSRHPVSTQARIGNREG